MGQRDNTYPIWRAYLLRLNGIFVLLTLALELVWTGASLAAGLAPLPAGPYLAFNLLLPTACNGGIYLAGRLLLRRLSPEGRLINYIPLFQMSLFATVLTCVHCGFNSLLSLYCFPIFASVVFDNRYMPRVMTAVDGVLLLAPTGARMAALRGGGGGPVFPFEMLLAAAVLFSCSLISSMLIHFQAEKNHRLRATTRRQMAMRERLERDLPTGLYNRAAFFRRLAAMTGRGETFSVVMLDIDDFKRINDTYGHLRGDQVLQALAELLLDQCPQGCLAARVGGEEFAILAPLGGRAAAALAEGVRTRFARRRYAAFWVEGGITVSCGVAQWEPGLTGEAVYHRADLAMYHAKGGGKNRTARYGPEVERALRAGNCPPRPREDRGEEGFF